MSSRSASALISIRGCSRGIFLVGLLALAGCPTQQQEIQSYRKVVDAGLPRPLSYQAGEPLSLKRAMALANQDNEQIGLQGENYIQALVAKSRAVAAFLPTVALQPDFTIEQAQGSGLTSAGPDVTPQTAASAGGFQINGQTWQRFEAPVTGAMNPLEQVAFC